MNAEERAKAAAATTLGGSSLSLSSSASSTKQKKGGESHRAGSAKPKKGSKAFSSSKLNSLDRDVRIFLPFLFIFLFLFCKLEYILYSTKRAKVILLRMMTMAMMRVKVSSGLIQSIYRRRGNSMPCFSLFHYVSLSLLITQAEGREEVHMPSEGFVFFV